MSTSTKPHPEGASQSKQVWAERMLVLLLGYSKLLIGVVVLIFVIASWSDLRTLLLHVSHLKAFGVELEVSQLEVALRKQAESVKAPGVDISPADITPVLARAVKVHGVFEGATILWVDDQPANNLPFRQLLRKLGAAVEPARTTAEALDLATDTKFDLVVSDIKRANENEDGIKGLAKLRTAGVTCPAVFYVGTVTGTVPQGALGITNRPDDLLNFVIDGLERARWSQVDVSAEPTSLRSK